jgi:hypothetical protein
MGRGQIMREMTGDERGQRVAIESEQTQIVRFDARPDEPREQHGIGHIRVGGVSEQRTR